MDYKIQNHAIFNLFVDDEIVVKTIVGRSYMCKFKDSETILNFKYKLQEKTGYCFLIVTLDFY